MAYNDKSFNKLTLHVAIDMEDGSPDPTPSIWGYFTKDSKSDIEKVKYFNDAKKKYLKSGDKIMVTILGATSIDDRTSIEYKVTSVKTDVTIVELKYATSP
ncbi:MAG: hypothetical protein OEZ01_00175 [Candidatus Heimdallarchaeota archaeon]|nr:hypothetical protein [Candidatus Heimdallarchaeota archaeon]